MLPASHETSLSPIRGYSEAYSGETYRITVRSGTSAQLQEIGIAANSETSKALPHLGADRPGWTTDYARFKIESGQMTTQLGSGKALDVFNRSIVKVELVRPNYQYPVGHRPGPYYRSSLAPAN